ncbi:MAG TPA: serine/threonine-protein kinase [Thermoanaerobaculia bacterium]|jgi:serine/threonine protein kinase|nr:serine/threonine-protein kinase [Thermoanaerobaculia bacterium]
MELIGRHFGHIRVTQVIGQGGMGDVYGGYDEKLERKVALKVLNNDQRLDGEARERLLREARALSRLDHPNICRIHDYIETRDVDLLVLEFIDGKTLHDAQGQLSHHEKVRIAIAIADVLVQAHRAGIVHRDLKPENVMLTNTGEVKVLDFGLARWLHKGRIPSDKHQAVQAAPMRPSIALAETTKFSFDNLPAESGPRREFLATAVGITLGTPLFMSPEQARGETLTPASDMFSFGLVLQTLFTGEDPHPMDLTAREVILRVARGETQPVKGAPGDVTALINRLEQLAPADRPTAVESAERLRFIEAKPQRIVRRSIVAALALIALLGAWRYTVDLRRERAIAVANREEADRQRAHAENLNEFMLGDLRRKLEPLGSLEILDDVAERALEYSNSLKPETMSAEELARSSKALNQLGEVRIGQGKPNEAMTIFLRSRQFAQQATKKDPSSAAARLAVATANFWVGDVHRLQGSLGDALLHYTAYMNGAEELAKQYPNNDDYRLERGYGHSVVASIYERQGRFDDALQHLRLTREIKAERVAAKPDDLDRQADLANTLDRIGFILERAGDLEGARKHYEMEFATYSRLATVEPRNTRWKDRLVTSHNSLAWVLELTGNVPTALEHRRAEVALDEELHRRDPANAKWHRNLAIAQMNLGNALRMSGDARGGIAQIELAQQTLAPLLARKETVRSWTRDLAIMHTTIARAHLASGNAPAAARSASAALKIFDTLPPADTASYIGAAYLVVGEAHVRNGEKARARDAWERGAALLPPHARDAAAPQVLDTLARTLLRLERVAEAAPLIERLTRTGYRAPDFVSATSPKRESV